MSLPGSQIVTEILARDNGSRVVKGFFDSTAQGATQAGAAVTQSSAAINKGATDYRALASAAATVTEALVAAGAAALASIGGLAALTLHTAEVGEGYFDLSQKIGVSVEDLSHYSLAAATAGVSNESLATGMRNLEKNAVSAARGNKEATATFAALNVSVRDASGALKPASQLLEESSAALGMMEDGAVKTTLAMKLFGRSALDLIPFFNTAPDDMKRLAEMSNQLGLTWTEVDAKAADRLSDDMTILRSAMQGLANSITREMMPGAANMVEALTEWIAKNEQLIVQDVQGFVSGVGTAMSGLASIVGTTSGAVSQAVAVMREYGDELELVVVAAAAATAAFVLLTGTIGTSLIGAITVGSGMFADLGAAISLLTEGIAGSIAGFSAWGLAIGAFVAGAAAALGVWMLKIIKETDDLNDRIHASIEAMQKLPAGARTAVTTFNSLTLELSRNSSAMEKAEADLKAMTKEYGASSPQAQRAAAAVANLKTEHERLSKAAEKAEDGMFKFKGQLDPTGAAAQTAADKTIILGHGMLDLFGSTKLTETELKAFQRQTNLSADELKALDAGAKPVGKTLDALKTITGKTGDELLNMWELAQRSAKGLDETGDAAGKAAKEQQKLTNELNQLKVAAAQGAAATAAAAIQTSNATNVDQNYKAAIQAITEAYGVEAAAAEASGEPQKKVQAMVAEAARKAGEAIVKTTAMYQQSAAQIANIQRQLSAAITSGELTLIADDIEKITSQWSQLDRETRESQLPSVLADIADKYDLLTAKARADAEAVKASLKTDEDKAKVDLALQLQLQHLNNEMGKEAEAARKAAVGMTSLGQAQQLAAGMASELSKALVGLIDGTTNLKDVGKQLFSQILDKTLVPKIEEDITNALLPAFQASIDALIDPLHDLFGGLIKAALQGITAPIQVVMQGIGSTISSGITSIIGPAAGSALGSSLGAAGEAAGITGATGLLSTMTGALDTGMMALADVITPGIAEAAAMAGASGGTALMESMGTTVLALADLGPVGWIAAAAVAIGTALAMAFGVGGPSMSQKIAAQLSKWIGKSFKDPEVVNAIQLGVESVGSFLTPELARMMVQAPQSMGTEVREAWQKLGTDSAHEFSAGFYEDMEHGGKILIHSSANDILKLFYGDATQSIVTGIEQTGFAAGSAIAAQMGFLGDKAVAFAHQWLISFLDMAHQSDWSAEQIQAALDRIAGGLGTSGGMIASLQALQAQLIEAGQIGTTTFSTLEGETIVASHAMNDLLKVIDKDLREITGKKVTVGNLDEAFAASGMSAVEFLQFLEAEMAKANIPIEQFGEGLAGVVLAASGDAGNAIKQLTTDFNAFGATGYGVGEILQQQVLGALKNVVDTALTLGGATEGVQAFGIALSEIDPSMLTSDMVAEIQKMMAALAVASHQSVPDLVKSFDPPLPDAIRKAVLGVNQLGISLGKLSGRANDDLMAVIADLGTFSDQIYKMVKDSDGKMVKELTVFGQELIDEATASIGGMWDTIHADSVVGKDEIAAVFQQISQIPAEALSDPAIQEAIKSLMAQIGAATGDASIIALANADTVTQEALATAMASYDEFLKHVGDNPPEVPPPESTAPPATDGSTPPPSSVPGELPTAEPPSPEVSKGWQQISVDITAANDALVLVNTTTATTSEALAQVAAVAEPVFGVMGDAAQMVTQAMSTLGKVLGESVATIEALAATTDTSTPAIVGNIGKVEAASFDLWKQLDEILTKTIPDLVVAIDGFSGDASLDLSTVFGHAVNVNSALNDLEKTRVIHIDMTQLDEALSKLGQLGGDAGGGGGGGGGGDGSREGGWVGLARGGWVAGAGLTANREDVLTWLTRGEFVIPRSAATRVGMAAAAARAGAYAGADGWGAMGASGSRALDSQDLRAISVAVSEGVVEAMRKLGAGRVLSIDAASEDMLTASAQRGAHNYLVEKTRRRELYANARGEIRLKGHT